VPGKKLGFQVMGSPTKGITYAGSVYQQSDVELNINGDSKGSAAGRATLNFAEIMGNKEAVMHVGVAGLESNYAIGTSSSSQTETATPSATSRGTMSSFRSAGRGLNNLFRGQVGGENCASNASYACASEYGASVRQRAYGLEGIYATGPFKLMGEYSAGDYRGQQQANQTKYDTTTYYLEAGFFITGEKYADSYKNGVFSSFKPKNEFDIDKGQWGAIELALRAEGYEVDNFSNTGTGRMQGSIMNSGSTNEATSGNKAGAKTYTAGVRWILSPNLIMKANYAQTNFDYAFKPIDITAPTASPAQNIDRERLLMFRTQYMF
jgi:phosphate-selective porin OprO/OprP